ncbi:nuclear transport factor 2 family protein [Acidovorax sp. NCPPB 3576]|uniref:nuclear transport factor 2 family protein n=1 Tax=Acidovorax sp. NCPPB 3576 TaxID=2940488 RepID=UPI002348F599|nr:nuclear transport factor 2 family protein [Acidovorax sp. NCPPB 3576]WCM90668.1 nuclear transport factor 2 family protein [Acidovorax sp. NCPPB 3576]
MKKHLAHWIFALGVALPLAGFAQVPVQPAADQQALLASADPVLRANKRLVYDFWREVFEAGQVAQAEKYVAESYVQHNPNVPTGRAAMVGFVQRRNPSPQPVEERIKAPLVSIVAERDMVILSFVREYPEPKDPDRKYTTTWFDMFRIENGKIAEHWDGAVKPVNP